MGRPRHDVAPVSITDRLKRVIWGTTDPRLRASWRVLLAGILFIQLSEPVVLTTVALLDLSGIVAVAIFQVAFTVLFLVCWARYVDQRRFTEYGFSLSRSWLLDLVAGFVAVLVGFGVWLGIGTVAGWATVEQSTTAPRGALVLGLGALLLGIALNVWVQETVFTGLVVKDTAEGLSVRGVEHHRAVIGAWLVGVLFFAWVHQPSTIGRVVNLLLVLGVYGLLYILSGELALPIGVHAGVNYAGGVLVASPSIGSQQLSLVHVTTSLSGVVGTLNGGAVPHVLLAFVVLVGWIKLREGEIAIETGLTQWSE